MKGFVQDIEDLAVKNDEFRRVLYTAAHGHSVRGTRAGGQRRGEEGASAQDDPRIARSRLPRRTSPGSIEQPGMIARDFRPWLIREAA